MPRFRPHKMYPGALLAQECCSYQASTELLMGLRGNLVVIIHSDRDCSNVLPKVGGIRAERDYKFFCTNMKEDELVTGQGNAKLRRTIEIVHQAYRPELILVLSTCPTVMIGDNVKNVSRKAGRDLGANVVAELTHGLKPKSPAEVVDGLYAVLCSGARPAEGDVERRVNLVGMSLAPPERAEVEAVLGAMGLTINVVLNEASSLDDFLGVASARWNVHPGPHLMLEFDEQCAKLGMRAVEVPLPFGVDASDRCYRAIAAATGVDEDRCEAAIRERRAPARAALDAFRTRLHERIHAGRGRGPRCAFNIGSVLSFDLRRVAHEEMGELPLLEELGFDVKLFIQGPQDDANHARVAAVLAELGVKWPFAIFPDPGGLAKHLAPGELDLFLGVDFLGDQLSKVNLPLLEKNPLLMGYAHVAHDLALLEEAIFSDFYRHFRPDGPAPRHGLSVIRG